MALCMQFSWHLLFYNTEYRRPLCAQRIRILQPHFCCTYISQVSCERTFHQHKEPDIETFIACLDNQTKPNKLPPFIHSKMANHHMNCHPSIWSSPGLEASLFPRTTADSAKQFCSCNRNREKRVHQNGNLTHGTFWFRQWSLHSVYQYIHTIVTSRQCCGSFFSHLSKTTKCHVKQRILHFLIQRMSLEMACVNF